jgi:hypothetical protein
MYQTKNMETAFAWIQAKVKKSYHFSQNVYKVIYWCNECFQKFALLNRLTLDYNINKLLINFNITIKWNMHKVSERLLFDVNCAIFQLYHGKYMLQFDDDVHVVLDQYPSWIFIVLGH